MKKGFRRFGFHKPDEMERHIIFKAQRNAYVFLILALTIWTFYESYKVYVYHTKLNLVPCMLLATAVVIQGLSQLIMTRSAVKDDEDSFETAPLMKIIILIGVVFSIIAVVSAAILFMSVKL